MLKDMKANTHLKPGHKGTKRLLERYGDKLLCVRYRYDEKRQVRIKTVEIIVSETPCTSSVRYRDHDIVNVMAPYAARQTKSLWWPLKHGRKVLAPYIGKPLINELGIKEE